MYYNPFQNLFNMVNSYSKVINKIYKICEEEADNLQVLELQNRIKEIIDKETR